MKKIALAACLIAMSAPVDAQLAYDPSYGESSEIFACNYWCNAIDRAKPDKGWQEISTLSVANLNRPDTGDTRRISVVLMDGKRQPLAKLVFEHDEFDLIEINICRSLAASDIAAPEAGLLLGVSEDSLDERFPGDGVYAWTKHLLGRFRPEEDDPFADKVESIATNQCRLVPDVVLNRLGAANEFHSLMEIPLVAIEGTHPNFP